MDSFAAMDTADTQKALLRMWAEEANHTVDVEQSPKAEFARLAKAKGWVGGDQMWCAHWEVCFGESYPYGARNMSATSKASAEEDVTTGLDDEMRRLSFGSDASSFSLVSRTSRADSFGSVHSLDTEQSRHSTELRDTRHSEKTFGVESGFEVSRKATRSSGLKRSRSRGSAESWDSKDSSNTLLSLDSVNSIEELSGGGVRISANDKNVESESDSDTQNPVYDPEPKATPDWYTFDGFVPSPTASFKSEFERLARHERWEGGRLKRHHMIELLKAEIFFHWDMRAQKLYHWQELCEELGIEKIPTTMTQCKKALKSVNVNLFSLIDHKRNPKKKIIQFYSHRELCRDIRNGNRFPKECAKDSGGLLSALLHRLW